jgi:hypothetical protein
MRNILADIFSLYQHICTLKNTAERYCPSNCPHCYKNTLWRHGTYYRQAQCENNGDPVPIPRFFCPNSEHTCSTLPEYIPPRRWYYGVTQQIVLKLLMFGRGVVSVSEEVSSRWAVVPCIGTLYRWYHQLIMQFPTHQFHLCNLHPELRLEPNYAAFWQRYLDEEGGAYSGPS